jgi:hypothetical protein
MPSIVVLISWEMRAPFHLHISAFSFEIHNFASALRTLIDVALVTFMLCYFYVVLLLCCVTFMLCSLSKLNLFL